MSKIDVTFQFYHFYFDDIEEAKQLYDLILKSYQWDKSERNYNSDVLLLTVSREKDTDKDGE